MVPDARRALPEAPRQCLLSSNVNQKAEAEAGEEEEREPSGVGTLEDQWRQLKKRREDLGGSKGAAEVEEEDLGMSKEINLSAIRWANLPKRVRYGVHD